MAVTRAVGRLLRVLARIVFVVVNNLYCIPSYVVWMMVLYPVKRWKPHVYWKIEGQMFHWLLSMVALWSSTAGYQIAEVGDDISECCGSRTLVLANHQSTADVPLLMAAFNVRPGVLPRLMWIMDRLFRYTNFGIVSVLHGDFFIVSGKDKRDASVLQLSRHLRNSFMPIDRHWIVLFPEGGFLRKRRETSQRYAAKNNLAKLNHVSLPRVGALKVIVDEMGPFSKSSDQPLTEENHSTARNNKAVTNAGDGTTEIASDKLRWILDITVAYEKAKPLDLTNIVTGGVPPCTTHLHYRLFPSTDIPNDHEGMTQWLYKRFEEKERLLEYFYSNGCFPALCPDGVVRNDKPAIIQQNPTRFFFISLFFIVSTIFQARIFYVIYQCATNNLNLILA